MSARRAGIDAGTRIWHLAQIREGASVGRDCNIGRSAYVGPGVGRAGRPLIPKGDGVRVCPETGAEYAETDGRLTER